MHYAYLKWNLAAIKGLVTKGEFSSEMIAFLTATLRHISRELLLNEVSTVLGLWLPQECLWYFTLHMKSHIFQRLAFWFLSHQIAWWLKKNLSIVWVSSLYRPIMGLVPQKKKKENDRSGKSIATGCADWELCKIFRLPWILNPPSSLRIPQMVFKVFPLCCVKMNERRATTEAAFS